MCKGTSGRYKSQWILLLGLSLLLYGLAACAPERVDPLSDMEPVIEETVTLTFSIDAPTQALTETATIIATALPPTPINTPLPRLTQTFTSSPTPSPTETFTPTLSVTQTKAEGTTPSGKSEGGSLPSGKNIGGSIVVFLIRRSGAGTAGCSDQAVPMSTGLAKTKDSIKDVEKALRYLVNLKQKYYGELYNPASYSTLRVQEVEYDGDNETLTVRFSGKYRPTANPCDNTAVKAQIWSTAKQFGIRKTNFYINGIPFGDLLSNN